MADPMSASLLTKETFTYIGVNRRRADHSCSEGVAHEGVALEGMAHKGVALEGMAHEGVAQGRGT